jgi:hypothetical protein
MAENVSGHWRLSSKANFPPLAITALGDFMPMAQLMMSKWCTPQATWCPAPEILNQS